MKIDDGGISVPEAGAHLGIALWHALPFLQVQICLEQAGRASATHVFYVDATSY